MPKDERAGTGRTRRTRTGDREDRKAEAADVVRDARELAGLTEQQLADDAGVSRAFIRGTEDDDDVEHIPHLDIIMSPGIARAAVRVLAKRCGMVAVDLPAATGRTDDELRITADVTRECSEAVVAHMAAIQRGNRTRFDTAAIRKEVWEAIEALVRLDQTLEVTEHEPVVGIRRAKEAP